MDNKQIDLTKLSAPLQYKWRVQSYSKNKAVASCVAYVDARAVMNRLDDVLGAENWSCRYEEVKGNIYCYIGIWFNDRLIEKSDCGTESNVDKEKGESSDAFKRAAVKWGVFRFGYDIPMQNVSSNEKKSGNNFPYPVDESGSKIWDLTKHINEKLAKNNYKKPEPQPVKKPEIAKLSEDDKMKNYVTKEFKSCNSIESIEKKRDDLLVRAKEKGHDLGTWFYDIYVSELDRISDIIESKELVIPAFTENELMAMDALKESQAVLQKV